MSPASSQTPSDRVREPAQAVLGSRCVHGLEPGGIGLGKVDNYPAKLGEDGLLASEHGIARLDRDVCLDGNRLQRGGGVAVAKEEA